MRLAPLLVAIAVCGTNLVVFARNDAAANRSVDTYLDGTSQQVVDGINSFSLDLLRQQAAPGQNLFMSPASVSTALGLAYRGAIGPTAGELRATLHYTSPPESYLASNASIIRSLNTSGDKGELHVTNAIWLDQAVTLRPAFATDIDRYAPTAIQRVDFRHDRQAARITINKWVFAKTDGKISELLQQEDVPSATRMVLINTVYWKGEWASPFYTDQTRTEPFMGLDGKDTPTPLMHQLGFFRSIQQGGAEIIQLPYAFGEISIVVLMPRSRSALPGFERSLNMSQLARWLHDLDATEARSTLLTLPKMHLEWRDDLVNSLRALGAKTPFSDQADFSGMVDPIPAETNRPAALKFGKVIHQTFFDLDEQGTEAAAATAVSEVVVSSRRVSPPPEPTIVRVDRPFLFILRNRQSNLILFIGRYVSP